MNIPLDTLFFIVVGVAILSMLVVASLILTRYIDYVYGDKEEHPVTFPCTGCGCCCKRVDQAIKFVGPVDRDHPLYFPYNWSKEGVCEKLTSNNRCSVYSYRPLICNVDRLQEHLKYDKKEFYDLNIAACNIMMEEDNIPDEFRIKT